MKHLHIQVTAQHPQLRLDQWIAKMSGESREFVKQQGKNIRVNSLPAKLSYKIQIGDQIDWQYIPPTLPPSSLEAEPIPLDILFEDPHLLVIHKPSGMVVHPAKGHWEGTLCHALLHHLGKNTDFPDPLRPGIVHRLDKDTRGLMIVAKDVPTQKCLSLAFAERKILKIYTALVQGHLSPLYGKIDAPIGRSKTHRLLFAIDPNKGRSALTEYQVLEARSRASLVKIRLHTGRTHQIRVHFQHIRHPIIGDPLYSRSYRNLPLCLAATKLKFEHPFSKEKLEFSLPIPREFLEHEIFV